MATVTAQKTAGRAALWAAVGTLVYSVSFVVLTRTTPRLGLALAAFSLTATGLLASFVLVAVYERVVKFRPGWALWALIMGELGAAGSIIHGGYDLANAIHQPKSMPFNLADLPSQIDPRGLLTFGLAGLSLAVLVWLLDRSRQAPKGLVQLGYAFSVVLVLTYLARLIILKATNPAVLLPAALAGFILGPLWYFWLGTWLSRAKT
jgi:hypothetical protein